ncbi:hypothetical protein DICPUDRAFT_81760 [Dictyostelium purpureum]|uniref:Uncharacterized protein n=1 Tax=Dictyostelium purpureum TaxID=5786 RepID=F0ZUH6_DICPU|nr:uncharacterized protein DICPUDRAFT_81760 [Dictyostelium purpureum]EGC32395.1 hypothetical protein DICPUDRAFT_81760 [Dictyostelium purpureum]|eukprot:XP_003291081.1 hypothetical protein DICPUDRAFT_81760 [Dictyostelium purpureum]
MKSFLFILFALFCFTKAIEIDKKPIVTSNFISQDDVLYLFGNFTDQNGGIRLYYKYFDIFNKIDDNNFFLYISNNNLAIAIPHFSGNNDIFKNNDEPITIKIAYGNGSEILPIETIYEVQSSFYKISIDSNHQAQLQGYYFKNSNENTTTSFQFITNLNETLICDKSSIEIGFRKKNIYCKLKKPVDSIITKLQFIDYNNKTITQDIDNNKLILELPNKKNGSNEASTNMKTQIPQAVDNKNNNGYIYSINNNSNNNINNNTYGQSHNKKWIPIALIIPTVSLILMIFLIITIIKRIKEKKRIRHLEESKRLNDIWYNVN